MAAAVVVRDVCHLGGQQGCPALLLASAGAALHRRTLEFQLGIVRTEARTLALQRPRVEHRAQSLDLGPLMDTLHGQRSVRHSQTFDCRAWRLTFQSRRPERDCWRLALRPETFDPSVLRGSQSALGPSSSAGWGWRSALRWSNAALGGRNFRPQTVTLHCLRSVIHPQRAERLRAFRGNGQCLPAAGTFGLAAA